MLKIDSPITCADIYNIVALSPGHPVFKLEGWGDGSGKVDALVIKMESTVAAATGANRRDVRVTTGLMSMVDPNAKTVVLSRSEIQELRTYADGGNVADTTGLAVAGVLKTNIASPNGVWTKMPLKNLVMLDKAIAGRLAGDKTDVRIIAAALKGSGGLEKLGQIIAADLFNGNNDRFVWPPPGQKDPDLPARFKTIWNIGNVMVASGANAKGTPIGLDSYDPNNQLKDLRQAVTQDSGWAGMLLGANMTDERKAFAEGVISDLEMALGPRNRKTIFGSQNRLGTARKERLLKGMLSGKNIIQQALVPLKHRPNLPVGLSSRMALLGW